MLKVWPINFAVFVCFQLGASLNSVSAQSFIKGNIDFDKSLWDPVAYLSIIPDFTQMHTITYETILERADIDGSGIGENLINELSVRGYDPNNSLLEIDVIADYLDTLDYYGTSLNRDFISQAVKEELEESLAGGLFSLAAILVIIILPVLIYYFRRKNKKGESSISSLSVQERRVFSMLQQGFSNKEISDELGISLSTVKTHVNNIFSKLKISSRRQVMDFKP